jgi:prephenate dehydratase
MPKVGFLGPSGSFSHEAANRYCNSNFLEVFETSPQDSFSKVFNLLKERKCLIVVPIDNSIEGLVTPVADLMIEAEEIAIIGEYILPIRQNLLVLPNTAMSDIKRIYSHPQALSQCRKFLEKMRGNGVVEEVAAKSTSEGAALVAESGDVSNAAIGGELAAHLNQLSILASDIADTKNNQTRFLVLARVDEAISIPSGDDKTFIIFSVKNQPGSLVRVLEVFDVLAVNMTMIQSRPSKKQLGEYVFFVEFEGHRSSSAVALDRARSRSVWLRVLGSYPIFRGQGS